MSLRITACALMLAVVGISTMAAASEPVRIEDLLEGRLRHFLANVDDRDTHDRFWSEDLVYTSSAGLRFGKDTIMEGFEAPEPSGVTYGAEDVVVRVYDDMAVITFTLVGNDPEEGEQRYLNTGTFRQINGDWQVIAWQATRAAEE